jgi:CRISPR-associated protein Cas2
MLLEKRFFMSEYIICYDITNPRRLGRIHRTLKQYAVPLQYSVFLFTGSAAQLAQCLARLQAIMDEHSDDIRAYPLPQRGLRFTLGPSKLPAGVTLGGVASHWQNTEDFSAENEDAENEDDD